MLLYSSSNGMFSQNALQELVPGNDGVLQSSTKRIERDNETSRSTDDPQQLRVKQSGQQSQMHTSMEAVNRITEIFSDQSNGAKSSSEFSISYKNEELHFVYGIQQNTNTHSNTDSSQPSDILLSNVTITISQSSSHGAIPRIKSSGISTGKLL